MCVCTAVGRDVQTIAKVLQDVDWVELADFLDINSGAIEENCKSSSTSSHLAQCYRRELVKSYCHKQTSGDPYKVAADIADILEEMEMMNLAGMLRQLSFSSELHV